MRSNLLEKQKILQHLGTKNQLIPFKVHLFNSIDSTNRYLKELPLTQAIDICCAETQTQGRGRFGRYWHSPFGENIYCSSRWNVNSDITKLSGLSLVTSMAILSTLKALDIATNVKIKWPNDILWGEKKLCGSLIELLGEPQKHVRDEGCLSRCLSQKSVDIQVIIGIGLNVNSDTKRTPLPDKPWCSLYEMTNHYYDRSILIAKLILKLDHYLTQFIQHDLGYFMNEWNALDYLAGKEVTVTQSLNTFCGIAKGINQAGQLILEEKSGLTHFLSSGDTSLQIK